TKLDLSVCKIIVIPNSFYKENAAGEFDSYEVAIKDRETVIDNLIRNIRATIIENSSVINISMESTSPELSEDVLNSIVLFYNKNAIKNKNAISMRSEERR